MSNLKRPDYDDIHGFVERIEDVLLSESSWSTSDSDCSGCLHLSKESLRSEEAVARTSLCAVASDAKESTTEQTPLVGTNSSRTARPWRPLPAHRPAYATTAGGRAGHRRSSPRRSSLSVDPLTASGITCSPHALPSHLAGRMMQQRGLLAAGAQPWNSNICAAQGRRFAYAATLVIYVYEAGESSGDWQLCSVLADHRKTITSLAWHPRNADLLASSSEDQRVCVWSVSQQRVMCSLSLCRTPSLVAWCRLTVNREVVSFSTPSGPIQLWEGTDSSEPIPFRESHPYSRGLRLYRWHPSVPGRLAVAHNDAKITLYKEGGGQVKSNWCPEANGEGGCGELATGQVVGMEWAECSPDYLLLSYSCGRLWLVDAAALVVVTVFSVPAAATVATMAWLPHAPGIFVTGDSGKGVLRVWTVSKSTPLHSYVLKDTGFHELCATRCHTASQAMQSGPSSNGPAVPAVPVLCLFKDGGVGLYHIRRKHWIFNREHGHTETIFDCSFKPEDSDQLATGSFDGSIKIWRVDTLDAVATLPNCRSIIYSVSWAPADLNCIAASTSTGRVFIWDVAKQKILQDFSGHKKSKVYCVAWNQTDSRRVASVGESGLCLVHEVSGQQLQCYQHPEPVYGCDWRNADTLATGCHDGRIRVYNVTTPRQEPSVVLKAHSKKVFRVKWNPVYSDILCSGSDDCSVRLWSVSRAQCLSVLLGHTDNVRGLAWCPALPFLLVSGAWDRSIRVWDARTARCLDIVSEHGADIYGLSIHPVRPFLVASCSRDSTVRLWSMAAFVAPLYLRLLANRPLAQVICATDASVVSSLSEMRGQLCGLRARQLLASQRSNQDGSLAAGSLVLAADLLSADVHVCNLWDLCRVVCGQEAVSGLSSNYSASIVHHSHLAKCDMAAAERELQTSTGQRGVADIARSSHQQHALEAVAARYLQCGAMRQYCDVMVRRGCWDHALAVAPAVSIDYWRDLLIKYGEQLAAEDSEQCVPYLVSARDLDALLHFRIARGQMKEAFSACVALNRPQRAGRKGPPPELPPRPSTKGGLSPGAVEDSVATTVAERQGECAALLAEWHLNKGSPVLAACAMLAADQFTGCLLYLLRGHELELCVVVARQLLSAGGGESAALTPFVDTAVRYLSYRAAWLALPDVAVDLASTHSQDLDGKVLVVELLLLLNKPQQQAALLARTTLSSLLGGDACSPVTPSDDPLQGNYQQPADTDPATATPDDGTSDDVGGADTSNANNDMALPEASTSSTVGCRVVHRSMRALLSLQPMEGVYEALEFVMGELQVGRLGDPDFWRVVRLLQSCPLTPDPSSASGSRNGSVRSATVATREGSDACPSAEGDAAWTVSSELAGAVLTVSAVTGAVKAALLEYTPVVPHLLALARLYIERYRPLHGEALSNFAKSLQTKWEEGGVGRVAGAASNTLRSLWPDCGLTRVSGSHLPRHSDTPTCCLTRATIKGPVYRLEGTEAVLGLNEALMLAKVHPFSPLGDCTRLSPF